MAAYIVLENSVHARKLLDSELIHFDFAWLACRIKSRAFREGDLKWVLDLISVTTLARAEAGVSPCHAYP
jgi:hypothetical protein